MSTVVVETTLDKRIHVNMNSAFIYDIDSMNSFIQNADVQAYNFLAT